MYKIPIGVDNFHELVTEGYLFCDKTAMIADFLKKGEKVTLITRPRRWGKTLNMSMLHHFLAPEVDGIPTAGLFDGLEIGKLEGGKYLKSHQGKHPVIMLSFKDINADNFEEAYNSVYELISTLYESYTYLFNSDKVNKLQLKKLYRISNNEANRSQLESSIKLLSRCLYQHHGQKVYILIDEYDTPLNKAYGNKDYLDAMVNFMRNLFSSCLKSNTSLEKGILTGILRVSKDSMLSGLNNLVTYTLLDAEYKRYFGFSESEVAYLFKENSLSISMEEVSSWYNGYRIGDLVMYNPWSILSCINTSGHFDVYWVNTGNNDLIKRSLFCSGSDIKSKFAQLMQGDTICVSINKHLSFELLDEDETAFWSLLLFAGYLKAATSHLSADSDLYDCQVSIPNHEVFRLYNRFFKEWLSSRFPNRTQYESFLGHLLAGNVPLFVQDLSNFLIQSVSVHDTHSKSESFYHGFVLALLASVSHTHLVRSNRESGYGRYDVLIIPGAWPSSKPASTNSSPKAILLEFKQVGKEEDLENAANTALAQIQTQMYRTDLSAHPHVQAAVEVGIAFSGKAVMAAYATYDLVNNQGMPVLLTSKYQADDYNSL